jgi:hypothetical protein
MPESKDARSDLLQGTLDLLILRTLASGPMHGWGISQRIQAVSDSVLVVNQGSLYPALYRLEEEGWIAPLGPPRTTGAPSPTSRRARRTPARASSRNWRLASAVFRPGDR